MDQQKITLISFGYFNPGFLRKVAESVKLELGLEVGTREVYMDLIEFYDPARRQYNANRLLNNVDLKHAGDSFRTIGLFTVDLFIPILTFIFGQAYLKGRTGVASTYRLGNELYGMDKDDDLLLERFKKEVIHELGHTLGLVHCHAPSCVMRSVSYVEDIDQKKQSFCPDCRQAMHPFF